MQIMDWNKTAVLIFEPRIGVGINNEMTHEKILFVPSCTKFNLKQLINFTGVPNWLQTW